jgi:hypothetical protein
VVPGVPDRVPRALRPGVPARSERRSPVGADREAQTPDLDLGKVALYQLSYVRIMRWRPNGRQRYNLPELSKITTARNFRRGPMANHRGFVLLVMLCCMLLVGADGFEPPCLEGPGLQPGAIDRSATHPKICTTNAQGPESCSEHPGLVAFDLFGLSVGVIQHHPGCFLFSYSNRSAHKMSVQSGYLRATYQARTTGRTRTWLAPVACLFCR